jgi:hypothetical protein
MTLREAVQRLVQQDGVRIRRAAWVAAGLHLGVVLADRPLPHCKLVWERRGGEWCPTLFCILAGDWEVIDPEAVPGLRARDDDTEGP